MKRFWMILVILVLMVPCWLQAANPTVTVALDTTYDDWRVYEATFTSAAASADSAIIWKDIDNETPWYIGYMTKDKLDSLIGVQLETTETTLDSIRHKLLYQVCYDKSPIASTVSTHDEWMTFKTTTADSAAQTFEFFNPYLYGIPLWFRVLWIETDAGKDATQTITLRLVFPKPR